MKGMDHDFLWPFLVALLAGLFIYLVQFFRQRRATQQALVGEINLLLRQCQDYFDYLSQDSHEWVHEGTTLSASPYFSRSSVKIYSALLPNLHLLASNDVLRVIGFYSHHDSCESLIEILFSRIRQQEQAGKPTTELQVALTKKRTKRITDALGNVLTSTNGCIKSLGDLPSECLLAPSHPVGSGKSD